MKLESAEHFRMQAKVCFGMAETAPTEAIKELWLSLSDAYTREAARIEKQEHSG